MSKDSIRPFATGSQSVNWEHTNCSNCKKDLFDEDTFTKCPILAAIYQAAMTDGEISEEIAKRMGYIKGPPFYYTWDCPEKEIDE
jgi:hypothetical protein